MLSIKLKKEEIDKLKLLLHDIELLQKQNNLFDNEAIEILSFKVIEHISNVSKILELPQQNDINVGYGDRIYDNEPKPKFPQQEISDEEIEKASKEFASAKKDLKHLSNREFDLCKNDYISACKWYREQLKSKNL